MIRLVHISDLHFATPGVRSAMQRLQEILKREIGVTLDIESDTQEVRDNLVLALANLSAEHPIDALLISGDITTFGDAESFVLARDWLRSLADARSIRNIVAVPGNHDVLAPQLRKLLSSPAPGVASIPFYLRVAAGFRFRKAVAAIKESLRVAGTLPTTDTLAQFRSFAEALPAITRDHCEILLGATQRIRVYPINSICTDPLWMNLGRLPRAEWGTLLRTLPTTPDVRDGTLRIAMLHHNLVSSPDVVATPEVFAYNSMPGAMEFLQEVQSRGVDLILHGHQHAELTGLFDCTLGSAGHVYVCGARSATAADKAGFNVIDIRDINHASLLRMRHDANTGFVATAPVSLTFERNAPSDQRTRTTRCELKRYVYLASDADEDALWDEMIAGDWRTLYISGRGLRHFVPLRQEQLRVALLGNEKRTVAILVSDERLLKKLADRMEDDEARGLWGPEGLSSSADRAHDTIELLQGFVSNLGSAGERVDVRVASTLLPFAGTVREPRMAWGRMVIRLLPLGALGELKMPVLKLSRRDDEALYQYYLNYFCYLLARGRHVAGGRILSDHVDQEVPAKYRDAIV